MNAMASIAPSQTAAASSYSMMAGLCAMAAFSGRHTYSAWAPKRSPVSPKTWSPGLNDVTSLPAASTSPASSLPRMVALGRGNPLTARTKKG